MPAYADMIVNDGTGTPVPRTFTATGRDGTNFKWRYVPAGQALLAGRTITVKYWPAPKPDQRIKVEVQVILPIVDAPAPVAGVYTPQPRVVDTNESKHLFWISPKGVQADRDDFAAFDRNILNNGQILDMLKNMVPPT